MAQVTDYNVGFGFKGQDGQFYGPNGSIGLYHLGEDFYTPIGVQFIVLGKLLGLTGNTGNVGGPHIHLAKWKPGNHADGYYVAKYNRTYYKATPSIWKAAGKVIEISTQNVGDAGKFVRWQADDGFVYEGFHMSRVDVKVGDLIGEDDMKITNHEQVDVAYQFILGRRAESVAAKEAWMGKDIFDLLWFLANSKEGQLRSYYASMFGKDQASIEDLKKQLAAKDNPANKADLEDAYAKIGKVLGK